MGPAIACSLPADLRTWEGSPQRWRWQRVERMAGPLARHARFFCALEECSLRDVMLVHPGIPEPERAARVAQLMQVVGLVLRRLRARATACSRPALPAAETLAARPALETWSRIQLELLRAHYGTGPRTLDLEALAEGFTSFAGGLLRVPVVGRRGIGEPDSAYYFAFAEFALLACELGLDADLWEPQLAHLVWTQEVYVHMQRPAGAPPFRFEDYAPRGKERVFDPDLAERARARVAGLTRRAELEPIHTHHCSEAFGDGRYRASGQR